MSVQKIKLIFNNDIRIVKVQKNLTFEQQFKEINEAVAKKFAVNSSFNLKYKDDEGDLISLSEPTDLEEAYDVKGLPKIYIELKGQKPKIDNDNTNNNTNEKEEKLDDEEKPKGRKCICDAPLERKLAIECYNSQVVECDGCGISRVGEQEVYHCVNNKSPKHKGGYDLCGDCYKGEKRITFDQFIRDIKRNNKLKMEVQKFLVDFFSFIKKSNESVKEAFNKTIKKYKELNNNEYIQQVIKEKLDNLVKQYEDLVKFIAKNINPNDALIYFDMVLTQCNNIKTFVLGIPPFKFLFDGLDKNNINFKWGETDNGNNKKKETKEEKQQRKINEKKMKLEKKKQKLLEKLKKLEQEENNLNQVSKPKIEEPKVEEQIQEPEEEEMSDEFQILEENNNNNNNNEPEIEIINEEEQDKDVVEEFIYQEKLDNAKSMGFSNVELIKALLVKYNGNLAQVIDDMLQG